MEEDILVQLMNKQREFQRNINYDPLIHEVASAIMSEGGELWAIAGGKWWKEYLKGEGTWGKLNRFQAQEYIKTIQIRNYDKIVEESVDVLHFLLTVWIQANITPQKVFEAYLSKMEINKTRQKNRY